MKNKRYFYISIILILAVLSCFISYKLINADNSGKKPEDTDITNNGGDLKNPDTASGSNVPDFPIDDNELGIYTIDPDTITVIPVTALVYGEEITPELITDYVIESMEDAYYFIDVNAVISEGDTVIVDFSADTPPCQGVSSEVEFAILDSFSQSLLDNIDSCTRIIFKTGGGFYKSDNQSYNEDYLYLGKKK